MSGASCVDKRDDTHVVLRLQNCAHVMHCGVLAGCDEQFAGCMSGADAGRVVGSQALAARWVLVAAVCIAAARAVLARVRFFVRDECKACRGALRKTVTQRGIHER